MLSRPLLFGDDIDTGLWNISLHCKGNRHHLYSVVDWLLLANVYVTGPSIMLCSARDTIGRFWHIYVSDLPITDLAGFI